MYGSITRLPRRTKRAILLAMDVVLVVPALMAALSLRFGMTDPRSALAGYSVLCALLLAAAPFIVMAVGAHRIKLQAMDTRVVFNLAKTAGALAAFAMAASYLIEASTPRSVPLIFGLFYFVACLALRTFGMAVLDLLANRDVKRRRVLIYGAGSSGVQLALALHVSSTLRPVAFTDDNANHHGLEIAGLRVCSPARLEELLTRYRVDLIVLAMPTLDQVRRDEILRDLQRHDVEVNMMPSYAELLDRGAIDDKLRTVQPDELLGRDKVDLEVPAVAAAYAGRSVMVTGAGGSIGSELCRQLVDCHPSRIVLFEHSEFALYNIDRELRAILPEGKGIEIATYLGSVTNAARVTHVMRSEAVELVLHAAAYKHVPLVEQNELEGAANNILGTRTVAEAAIAAHVERFVLVSTDKAVRPTNIMGATKRLAELVVQDLQTRSTRTKFSIVRFGNVLGSSGSVLPLFQRQIEQGGPVTVTHPDVTRYFMTIPEAARLVLLAGAFSKGGDVFVLDMGKPIRIEDIARQMIRLSGRSVCAEGDGNGIAITFTGLRPGEKLYEELLIDDDSLTATPHSKILRAEEEALSEIETAAMVREISAAVDKGDPLRVRRAVRDYVRGYHLPNAVTA